MLRCSKCGRDIDAIGQDNVSCNNSPLCEDCAGMNNYTHTITVMELVDILRRKNENLKVENKELQKYKSAWNRLKERNLLLRTPDMRLLTHEMEEQEKIFNLGGKEW